MIYYELEKRHAKQMSKVLVVGSGAAVILYSLVGIFGYLTFVYKPDELGTNILIAPYNKNAAITIVSITFLILFREISLFSLLSLLPLHFVYYLLKTQLKSCFGRKQA